MPTRLTTDGRVVDGTAEAAQARATQLSAQVSDLASALASLTGAARPNPAPAQQTYTETPA